MRIHKISRDIKSSFISIGDEKIPYEFSQGDKSIGIIIFPPDPSWLKPLDPVGSMYLPLIDNVFSSLKGSGYCVMRVALPLVNPYTYSTYLFYASLCLEQFISLSPSIKQIWVVGHSFGSLLAIDLLLRRQEIDGAIMISPAIGVSSYNYIGCITTAQANISIIYGTNDKITPPEVIEEYAQGLTSKKMSVSTFPIAGDHSLTGRESYVSSLIERYLSQKAEDLN